jgi:hypothetical protein
MAWVMVDIEADGPIPGDYSMVCFGAVIVDQNFIVARKTAGLKSFYGKLTPISNKWVPEALAVSGFSREETLTFDDPHVVMEEFERWLVDNDDSGRPMFIADNNGFDWQFINWYFHHFLGRNPFGFSSTNLGSLYKGMVKNMRHNFKHLRKTSHTHNPVDDATGNVEAFMTMMEMGLLL